MRGLFELIRVGSHFAHRQCQRKGGWICVVVGILGGMAAGGVIVDQCHEGGVLGCVASEGATECRDGEC
jgi:hypothetical protein